MTGSSIERLPFSRESVTAWKALDPRHRNWPTVYVIDGSGASDTSTSTTNGASSKTAKSLDDVYVGETVNAAARMLQAAKEMTDTLMGIV